MTKTPFYKAVKIVRAMSYVDRNNSAMAVTFLRQEGLSEDEAWLLIKAHRDMQKEAAWPENKDVHN